jgi:CPA2 family monovalent cation:H+ antiporter-2
MHHSVPLVTTLAAGFGLALLLMFGVDLHFSLQDLLAVRRIALPGAVVQMLAAAAMGAGAALQWGWSATEAVVFGLPLSGPAPWCCSRRRKARA